MSAVAHIPDEGPLPIEIGPMRRRHLRSVMRIEALVYPRPWSAALFMQEIARRSDRHYIVARLDSEVVGYGGIMTSGLEAHITTIAVDPDFQRRKVAMKLMLSLVQAAVDRGGQTMSLEVRRSNEPAQGLYERFGFHPVGIRKGYYVETGEDALVMWVDSIDTPQYSVRLEELARRAQESF